MYIYLCYVPKYYENTKLYILTNTIILEEVFINGQSYTSKSLATIINFLLKNWYRLKKTCIRLTKTTYQLVFRRNQINLCSFSQKKRFTDTLQIIVSKIYRTVSNYFLLHLWWNEISRYQLLLNRQHQCIVNYGSTYPYCLHYFN